METAACIQLMGSSDKQSVVVLFLFATDDKHCPLLGVGSVITKQKFRFSGGYNK